jgi:hypothetical protein
MPDRYKILGNLDLAEGGVDTGDLYTVPTPAKTDVNTATDVSPKAVSVNVQTLLTTIVVCEDKPSTSASSFTITVTPSGGSAYNLFFNNAIASRNTKVLTLNLTLSAGDKVSCTVGVPSGSECSFTAFGVEMITGSGPIS